MKLGGQQYCFSLLYGCGHHSFNHIHAYLYIVYIYIYVYLCKHTHVVFRIELYCSILLVYRTHPQPRILIAIMVWRSQPHKTIVGHTCKSLSIYINICAVLLTISVYCSIVSVCNINPQPHILIAMRLWKSQFCQQMSCTCVSMCTPFVLRSEGVLFHLFSQVAA